MSAIGRHLRKRVTMKEGSVFQIGEGTKEPIPGEDAGLVAALVQMIATAHIVDLNVLPKVMNNREEKKLKARKKSVMMRVGMKEGSIIQGDQGTRKHILGEDTGLVAALVGLMITTTHIIDLKGLQKLMNNREEMKLKARKKIVLIRLLYMTLKLSARKTSNLTEASEKLPL